MYRIAIISIIILLQNLVFAQPNFPGDGELFKDTSVPRVDITIDPDTLEWLYEWENLESDIEYTATFVYDNGSVRDTVYPVGFRLRGNTSRHSQKKSFKVSFNRFTPGGKYYGVEKLNLNGEHNDPSVIRSKVCWDILRKMEIPAPRSNHVEVYINGDYYGLYINVEHIDEEFVKSRFGHNDGNLYKCLYPANLNYLGSSPENYKLTAGDRRVYDLKTNTELDDYADIAHFIDVLNNTSATNLKCQLDAVFNSYDYLKMIAADVLFGNWDGYIYNQNNFYLYQNTSSGKMEYIPYDLDNTLGIDWLNRDWGNRNMYDWQQHGNNYRPLYQRLINDSELRKQYTFYMDQLVNITIDTDSLIESIENRRDMIAPYLENDPFYSLDYGYSMNDFYNSFYQPLGGHVDYGLFPYITTRVNSIKDQLENTSMKPVIKYIQHQRSSASSVWIRAKIDVESSPTSAKVLYQVDGSSTLETVMLDDGQHNDGMPDDGIFGGLIDNIPINKSVDYQVKVSDGENLSNTMPCTPVTIPAAGEDDTYLYINEFMASNDNTIADEYGEYDDWIEVYNPLDVTVWLGDKVLTDNLGNPDKWQMPDAYIQPGEFLIFWADGQPEQGDFHTSFKLDKDGEEIGIFDVNQVAIDQYVFGPQNTDISEGRLPNGGLDWVFFDEPTPGASNKATSTIELNSAGRISLYPNPVSGDDVQLSESVSFKVYDMMGHLVEEQNVSHFINIQKYNKGMYFVVIEDGQSIKLIVQ